MFGVKLAVLMDTVMASVSVVVVPVVGLRVSHAASSLADHVSIPLPEFVILKSLDVGFAPPWVPLNASVDGLKVRAGCAVTVREAVMV